MEIKDYLRKLDYYKILKHLAIGVDVLFACFLLFNYLNYLPEFWIANMTYVFFFVIAINTIFLAFKINKIPEAVRDKSSMIYYFSHFFLLSLVIIVLNQFLKRQFIINFMPEITILSIALGFLTFYAYRNKVEKEIEDEKVSEEKAEKKRYDEFYFFFFFWNKIPLVRRFVKWMYKVGWWYSVGLILIILMFLFVKIYFVLFTPVLVSDDVQSIFVGNSIVNGGGIPSIGVYGTPYLRGVSVSVVASLFFYLFGFNIHIAKLVPAFFVAFSFFIFYLISTKLIKNKKILLLTLALFVFHPLIIFNHWFIRFYVFYELFFVLSIFFLLNLLYSINEKRKLKVSIFIVCLLISNSILWFFSYDKGKIMIVLATFLGIFYIILSILKDPRKKLFYIFGVIFTFILVFIFSPLKNELNFFLLGNLPNTEHLDLFTVFFEKNFFLSLSLILGLLFFFSLKNEDKKLFYFVVASLFSLHLLSSGNLQISRGILYLIPGLLLSFGILIPCFYKIFNKNSFIFFGYLFIIINLFLLYPPGYINNHPYLENELHYQDDLAVYNFIKLNLGDYKIIQSNYEILQESFFGVKTEYIFITNEEALKKVPYFYYDSNSETYRQISTKTPVISDKVKFFYDLEQGDLAVIIASHKITDYLDEETINKIEENLQNKKEFEGYIIYYD